MEEKTFELFAFVQDISPIVQIIRTTKPNLLKRTVTLITEDNQKVFMEIRNTNIKEIQREGIEVNSYVKLNYVFEGSEKVDMKYNNIIIKKIQLQKR